MDVQFMKRQSANAQPQTLDDKEAPQQKSPKEETEAGLGVIFFRGPATILVRREFNQ